MAKRVGDTLEKEKRMKKMDIQSFAKHTFGHKTQQTSGYELLNAFRLRWEQEDKDARNYNIYLTLY